MTGIRAPVKNGNSECDGISYVGGLDSNGKQKIQEQMIKSIIN